MSKGQTGSNVIKNAVKVIIDNLVPESCKVLIFANRHQLKATDKQLETLRTSSKYKFEEYYYQFHLLARTLSFLETGGPVFNYQGLATADRLKVVVLLKGDLLIYQIHQIVLE